MVGDALQWLQEKFGRPASATDSSWSPTARQFRCGLLSVPAYREWFEFGEDLNRLGSNLLEALELPAGDSRKLAIAALFVRAHKSFQSAMILAESGLIVDARAVVRSGAEGAIALNALAADPRFLDQLIDAHHVSERKKARLVLNDPTYRASYSAKQIFEMQATVEKIDAMEEIARRKFADIIWANVALKHCRDLYDLVYRQLSSDGIHTSVDSLDRWGGYHPPSKQMTDTKLGPDAGNLMETLKAANLMLLWAAIPLVKICPITEAEARLGDMLERFSALPQGKLDGAVTPKF